MPAGGNPIETGSNEERIAQLESYVSTLLSRETWLPGDYLDSEQAPPEFLAGTLHDGGRPGWWLANGAAYVQADDPKLKDVLNGAANLPDYRGKVRVAPNGATFLARGTLVGGETVTLATANLPSHSHNAGTLDLSAAVVLISATITIASVTDDGNAQVNITDHYDFGSVNPTITGSTATTGSGTGVSTIQPSRTIGATWIKR